MSEPRFQFRFSPFVTITCLILSALMLKASAWQWDRYKKKVQLVETYKATSESAPLALPLPSANTSEIEHSEILHRKVSIRGKFDLEHQLIVTNRKDASGPGHLLFAPFRIANSEHAVMVSRGFIPFVDREYETWAKFSLPDQEMEIQGVVQITATAKTFGPKNPETSLKDSFKRLWYFVEIPKMAKQLPYPLVENIYLQQILPEQSTGYPSQYIRIEVPPSTHFGYTIEWAILAFVTILIGIGIQSWPRKDRYNLHPEFEKPLTAP